MPGVIVQLPIDVVPNTTPPRFRWKQIVDSPAGKRVVDHEGTLPPSLEVAVSRLVEITRQLLFDNAGLQGQVVGMAERIAAQSELLGKKAEKPAPAPAATPPRKGK